MKSNLKRLLSMALVLVMVLSLVPATVFAAEGDSAADAAQNVATGVQYADLSQAISEAQPGQIVKALANAQDVVYDNQGVILDLNGYDLSVTVSEGVTVSAIDSATDDYEGEYGTLTTDGKVATTVKTDGEVKSYVTIAENGSYSFHRYYAAIAAISLKPTQVALGYRAEFRGDEAVKNAVINYGYELWVNNGAHKTYTRTDALTKSSLTLLLQNIMAEGNEALNAIGSTATIGGNAFVTLELNGEQVKLSGTEKQTTLRQVVESVNANVSSYGEAQLESVRAMITTYAAWMEGWNTAAIFGGNQGEGTEGDLKVEIVVDVVAQGNVLSQDATMSHGGISATVPAGAILEDGATQLVLTITEKTSSDSDVTQGEGESLIPLDVHIAGISADNTTPIIICLGEVLPKALNIGNYDLFHVEDGKTVPMTHVSIDELDAHNEFSYDPATGSVTVAMASFSEIALLSNNENSWNGNIDTAWADKAVLEIANADQLAGFGKLVDNGNTFAGKTITLIGDIDLYGTTTAIEDGEEVVIRRSFNPIGFGYAYDTANGRAFMGTFDGNGNTIYNLYQNGWDLGYSYGAQGGGLFASVEDATIKNLTMDGANIVMECVDMGVVVGYAQGDCTFENIVVKNSSIANYQRYTGGAIGEVSNGHHILKNVDVEASTTVGTLWGDFDAAVGGIIGGKWGHSYNNVFGKNNQRVSVYMENCDVAAELDVYNDVTSAYQWYSYRRAGMLIGFPNESKQDENGRTEATASFLETANCTVQYGDWVNYHYCEFTNTTSLNARYPWVRVEAGKNCGAYSNPRYGVPQFTNTELDIEYHAEDDGCHVDGDGHDVLIVFNQLYGGGQGCYGGNGHINKGVIVIGENGTPVESAPKFESTGVDKVLTGATVTLGELFQAVDNADIQDAYVYAFVSPVDANDTVRGTTAEPKANTNWQDLTITFSGTGLAKVTISDYYYCINTTLVVDVVTPVVRFHAYNNTLTTATGNTVSLVDPTTCPNGYTFVGWSKTPLAEETDKKPTTISGETYTPTAATTNLYAVYSRTVTTEGETTASYEKVTSAPTDWSGKYLIVYENGKVAFNGGLETLDAANNNITVTISNNKIQATDEINDAAFTIAKSESSYTIQSAKGYYIGNTANSNKLNSSTSTKYTNTITMNADGSVHIVGSGKSVLRYNANSGNYRFRYFKSDTYTGQKAIHLYKYTKTTESNSETSYITYEVTCQHTNTTITTVDATCTTAGSTVVTCDDCGETISTETIPATGHSYAKEITTTPGCETVGEATLTCSSCGDSYTEEIAATGHKDQDEDDYCDVCTVYLVSGYEVTLSVNGVTTTQTCTSITLTNSDDLYGYEFVGWSTEENCASQPEYKAGDTFEPKEDTTLYAVYCKTSTSAGGYVLATSNSDLADQKEAIFVGTTDGKNYALSTEQKTNNRGTVAIADLNNLPNSVQIIKLDDQKDGTYALNVGNGYLYAAASGSNHLKTHSTINSDACWTIAFNGEQASVIATKSSNRNVMQFNPNKGQESGPLFACYASASQTAFSIYVKQSGSSTTYTTAPVCSHENTDDVIITEAGCVTTGSKNVVCTDCGKTTESNAVISATGHNYGTWIETIKPTCCATGFKTATCANCGDNKTETIAATGEHTYEDGCTATKPETPVEPVTASLSFANKAQRTSFSTSEQVWKQNGITFTNNKAASTSDVADYANPARLYANSSVTVTAGGQIKKIVFDCNSSSYATALKTSIGTVSGATVSVSSDKVTVTFTSGVESFTIAKLTAQIRLDAITVTYES